MYGLLLTDCSTILTQCGRLTNFRTLKHHLLALNHLNHVLSCRGESCSLASAARKNRCRVIESVTAAARKKLGRRGDLIIRKEGREFGAGESGRKYEGVNGTKLLRERGLKLPKMLKDIFVELGEASEWDESKTGELLTVGFVHSGKDSGKRRHTLVNLLIKSCVFPIGLYMMLLLLDQPAGYVCRISRSKMEKVAEDVTQFD